VLVERNVAVARGDEHRGGAVAEPFEGVGLDRDREARARVGVDRELDVVGVLEPHPLVVGVVGQARDVVALPALGGVAGERDQPVGRLLERVLAVIADDEIAGDGAGHVLLVELGPVGDHVLPDRAPQRLPRRPVRQQRVSRSDQVGGGEIARHRSSRCGRSPSLRRKLALYASVW